MRFPDRQASALTERSGRGTDPELGGRGAQTEREDIELARGYLKVGDVVTCEIEGIGRLRARVVLSGHSRRKTSARSKPARDRRV